MRKTKVSMLLVALSSSLLGLQVGAADVVHEAHRAIHSGGDIKRSHDARHANNTRKVKVEPKRFTVSLTGYSKEFSGLLNSPDDSGVDVDGAFQFSEGLKLHAFVDGIGSRDGIDDVGFAGTLSISPKLSVHAELDLGIQTTAEADFSVTIAPTYTFLYVPDFGVFASSTLSAKYEKFDGGAAFNFSPVLTLGSVPLGANLSLGYTSASWVDKSDLLAVNPSAASYTTGPVISLNWDISSRVQVAATALPDAETKSIVSGFIFNTESEIYQVSANIELTPDWNLGATLSRTKTVSLIFGKLEKETELKVSMGYKF
jgi:hypothetical protein